MLRKRHNPAHAPHWQLVFAALSVPMWDKSSSYSSMYLPWLLTLANAHTSLRDVAIIQFVPLNGFEQILAAGRAF
jgi:hypothetical protein